MLSIEAAMNIVTSIGTALRVKREGEGFSELGLRVSLGFTGVRFRSNYTTMLEKSSTLLGVVASKHRSLEV